MELSFKPPIAVQNNAKKALEVRATKPDSQKGLTAVGIARARDLSNGRSVSFDTIKRMKAYFDRHQVDKQGSTWSEQGKGWIAWFSWGADEAYEWAKLIIKRHEAAIKLKKAISKSKDR